MHYALDDRETKQHAYQYAIKNDIKIPENWKKSEAAGTEWFYLFLNRNKIIYSYARSYQPQSNN